jgi:hypothetical protein
MRRLYPATSPAKIAVKRRSTRASAMNVARYPQRFRAKFMVGDADCLSRTHVRIGSKADIAEGDRRVRSVPKADIIMASDYLMSPKA